ncbi:hypothetical protein UPYG_G00042030 [Umbra pygmaea]|uniref:Uncharacterized protein n=1 Tax=Umbra pygmaea TaxID=75934 RepID=A0ABD0XQB9_UMBPY
MQVGPLPVLPGNRGTSRRHLDYQVEDFSSTLEEYLEKIERQTEEIVHMRAQLALQSGPGNSLLCHIGTRRKLHAPLNQGIQLLLDNLVHCLSVKAGSGNKTIFRDLFLRTILQRAIRKNAATRDATDEAVQNQVTRYLKGAADRAGGRRRRGGPRDLP